MKFLLQLVLLFILLGVLYSVWKVGFLLLVAFFGIFVWLEVTGP